MPADPKQPLQIINMITFGGGYSLPAWVAQHQVFFAKHGIRGEHHAYAEFGVPDEKPDRGQVRSHGDRHG